MRVSVLPTLLLPYNVILCTQFCQTTDNFWQPEDYLQCSHQLQDDVMSSADFVAVLVVGHTMPGGLALRLFHLLHIYTGMCVVSIFAN